MIVRALLAPLVAGAGGVLAFAPFHAWPAALAALAVLFATWRASGSAREAALSGFAFGLGYFHAGVWWVFVSLHEYGSMPAPLAALATFLFCSYLALFPALAGALTVRLAGASPGRRVLLAAPVLVACEWLRGWLFTGFPWLDLGTSQVGRAGLGESPLAGIAPYLGAYGVGLAVAGCAALAVEAVLARGRPKRAAACVVAIGSVFAAGAIGGRIEWTTPAGPPVSIGLLQGNVPQELKWREDMRTRTLLEYRRMIMETRARIVVIPETALPAFLDQLPRDYVSELRAHAREAGKEILIGTAEREPEGGDFRYYNSLVRLTGDRLEAYRKRHLVPFGEFIPPGFGFVLRVLRIPMSDFSPGAGAQGPLVAAGVPFGVAICYEDIFGAEMLDFVPRAQVLLNVSNVAWFGRSFAADQHLQFSQVRALETGRWMVRSTNTGATAAIDHRGRVVAALPQFTQGALLAEAVPRRGSTPYSRWGDWPALALVAALGVLARPRRL